MVVVDLGEEPGEEFLTAGLAAGGGVVVLGFARAWLAVHQCLALGEADVATLTPARKAGGLSTPWRLRLPVGRH